ncbi:putative NODULIN-LIKE PROTEIN [Salix viminalis]|uniref:NODULIN-LIKE PROTEIN n=1 Tax=Salix viminalis TaxID=40686 RepID=A0A9Q0QBY5_SALVM|nr:putative NODULIN-LIKE PROTEIN [Salix viminalis]
MAGQSRKWMILVATLWIQAFTGTNFDFSAYSSDLKSVLGISQVQLNYLAVASDLGKLFGWSSGLALMYFPLWVVLFMAAFMGFVGYGLQWLVIRSTISMPYILIDWWYDYWVCEYSHSSVCFLNFSFLGLEDKFPLMANKLPQLFCCLLFEGRRMLFSCRYSVPSSEMLIT